MHNLDVTSSISRSSKCTKIVGGWGFVPDTSGGAYSAFSDPLAGFKGPTFKGLLVRGWSGGDGRRKGEGSWTAKRSMPPGSRNPRAATECKKSTKISTTFAGFVHVPYMTSMT